MPLSKQEIQNIANTVAKKMPNAKDMKAAIEIVRSYAEQLKNYAAKTQEFFAKLAKAGAIYAELKRI